jgi:hypothetical protein
MIRANSPGAAGLVELAEGLGLGRAQEDAKGQHEAEETADHGREQKAVALHIGALVIVLGQLRQQRAGRNLAEAVEEAHAEQHGDHVEKHRRVGPALGRHEQKDEEHRRGNGRAIDVRVPAPPAGAGAVG